MKRRGFLAGILAAGMAPAIIHNPMKIFVPKVAIDDEHMWPMIGRGLTQSVYHIDEMPFVWKPELVLMAPWKDDGIPIRQLHAQPMFRHITNLPVMSVKGVGIDNAIRSLH